MVYLETKFDFRGNDVKNIKVAIDDPEPGTKCDISGWGKIQHKDEKPDHLQWANVTITSNQICQHENPLFNFDPEVMICAGGKVRTF